MLFVWQLVQRFPAALTPTPTREARRVPHPTDRHGGHCLHQQADADCWHRIGSLPAAPHAAVVPPPAPTPPPCPAPRWLGPPRCGSCTPAWPRTRSAARRACPGRAQTRWWKSACGAKQSGAVRLARPCGTLAGRCRAEPSRAPARTAAQPPVLFSQQRTLTAENSCCCAQLHAPRVAAHYTLCSRACSLPQHVKAAAARPQAAPHFSRSTESGTGRVESLSRAFASVLRYLSTVSKQT